MVGNARSVGRERGRPTTTNKVYRFAEQGVLEAHSLNVCSQFPSHPGSVAFQNTFLYQPPASGDPNQEVEMYNTASWVGKVWPGLAPSCGYRAPNGVRGTTLHY